MRAKVINEISDAAKMNFVQNYWAKLFVGEYEIRDLGDVSPSDLASFIDTNWNEITGLTNRDKDEEGYFPGEVEEILDELEVDYTDFSDEWGMVREGSDDWEDEDEDEDDEESAEDTNDEAGEEFNGDDFNRDDRDFKKSWGGSQELL
jgi:Ran GTPase-activating protein (RanGAP) involved in mRNA processing and transport